MNILALRQALRAFDVCADAITARVVEGLLVLLMALALTSCSNGEQTRPAAANTPPATSAPPPVPAAPEPAAPEPAPAARRPAAPEPSAPEPPPSAPRRADLPTFPWPPPRYSAFSTIARQWVAPGARATLASAANRLEEAFDAAGYGERSYYWIPDGFALVSRIEQIQSDATPVEPPARWAVETPKVREGFIDHIRALFNAPPGFYRVIVFTVTNQDFAAGERPPTSNEARNWISAGLLRLPETVGIRPYSEQHYTTALIYEFERRADQSEPRVKAPSDSPGRVHLEKAGLWQALARP